MSGTATSDSPACACTWPRPVTANRWCCSTASPALVGVARILPGLAAHYRVICPDLRGAGWTDAPLTGYDREQLLADVVALLDALELDRVCLIAHDWGALLGYELCLSAPHRVRKYVSLGVLIRSCGSTHGCC